MCEAIDDDDAVVVVVDSSDSFMYFYIESDIAFVLGWTLLTKYHRVSSTSWQNGEHLWCGQTDKVAVQRCHATSSFHTTTFVPTCLLFVCLFVHISAHRIHETRKLRWFMLLNAYEILMSTNARRMHESWICSTTFVFFFFSTNVFFWMVVVVVVVRSSSILHNVKHCTQSRSFLATKCQESSLLSLIIWIYRI